MLTKNDLHQIKSIVDTSVEEKLEKKLSPIRLDIHTLKSDVGTLKSDVGEIKVSIDALVDATGNILEWTDDIHRAVTGPHKKLVSL